MRILREPKVYLVARPAIAQEGWDAFLRDAGLEWPTPISVSNAARITEMMGRNCYMSYGKKAGSKTNQKYIDNLIGINRSGPAHGSVTEHVNWSFIVIGAGRGFSHEQVRHRVGWAYSQLSTRYCDFEREEMEGTWDPGFVVPPLAQLDPDTIRSFEEYIEQSRNAYTVLLDRIMQDLNNSEEFKRNLEKLPKRQRKRALRKAARGAARDILPIATEAIMGITGNARSIWNTIALRANEHAEGAIRSVYVQIAKIMEGEFPELFKGLEYYKAWDGSWCVKMPREKL